MDFKEYWHEDEESSPVDGMLFFFTEMGASRICVRLLGPVFVFFYMFSLTTQEGNRFSLFSEQQQKRPKRWIHVHQ